MFGIKLHYTFDQLNWCCKICEYETNYCSVLKAIEYCVGGFLSGRSIKLIDGEDKGEACCCHNKGIVHASVELLESLVFNDVFDCFHGGGHFFRFHLHSDFDGV